MIWWVLIRILPLPPSFQHRMEATPENLQALATYLTQTLSDKYEIRKPAEDYLMSVEGTPNYAMLLLQLTDSEQVEMHIRLAASINFKNFVKRNWRIVEEKPNKVRLISVLDDPLPYGASLLCTYCYYWSFIDRYCVNDVLFFCKCVPRYRRMIVN